MKLEELVRDHIDSAARPVALHEIRERADSQSSGGLQAIAILDPDSATAAADLDTDPASRLGAQDSISGHISQPRADSEDDQAEAIEIKRGLHLGFWLQAAAVFVAVGLSATAMLWYQDGRPTNIDTAATPEAQAAAALATMDEAANATNRGWAQNDDPDNTFLAPDITELIEVAPLDPYGVPWGQGPSFYQVWNIQHLASGYYAVGSHRDELVSSAAIWWSDDAVTWIQVLGTEQGPDDQKFGSIYPVGTALYDIAQRNGTIVAIGSITSDRSTPSVWVQTADEGWQMIPLPVTEGLDAGAFAIIASERGFLASGQTYAHDDWESSNAAFWHSQDGLHWDLVEASGFEPDSQVRDLVAVGQTLVAVGSVGRWDGVAAAWTSTDGGTKWERSLLPEASIAFPVSAMQSLAVGPEGLLAIGLRSSDEAHFVLHDGSDLLEIVGTMQLAVWTSLDGREWIEHPGPSDSRGHEIPHSVEWGPAGFLITSTSVWLDGSHGSSWLTVDGIELTRLGDPRDVNVSATAHVGTPDGYITLADPEFHFTTAFNGEEPESDEEPHRLEVWKLEVTKADD